MGYQTWQNLLEVADLEGEANVLARTSIALQSQYSASKNIGAFGTVFQDVLSPEFLFKKVVTEVANVYTAKGVFLTNIGKKVGARREIVLNGVKQTLDDDLFRFLVLYLRVATISNASIKTMNELLTKLLGFPVYVVDNQDMTISIRILGEVPPIKLAILKDVGLLTKGTAVGWNIKIINPAEKIFGFNGSGLNPFDVGAFLENKEIES